MRLRESEQLEEQERRGGVARGGGEGDDEDRLDGVLVSVRLRVRVRVRVRLTLTLTLTLTSAWLAGLSSTEGPSKRVCGAPLSFCTWPGLRGIGSGRGVGRGLVEAWGSG